MKRWLERHLLYYFYLIPNRGTKVGKNWIETIEQIMVETLIKTKQMFLRTGLKL